MCVDEHRPAGLGHVAAGHGEGNPHLLGALDDGEAGFRVEFDLSAVALQRVRDAAGLEVRGVVYAVVPDVVVEFAEPLDVAGLGRGEGKARRPDARHGTGYIGGSEDRGGHDIGALVAAGLVEKVEQRLVQRLGPGE